MKSAFLAALMIGAALPSAAFAQQTSITQAIAGSASISRPPVR